MSYSEETGVPSELLSSRTPHDAGSQQGAFGMSRTIEQRTNLDGFPKASELIKMTGLEDIEASQRAISNLLYQHAHDSGRIADPTAVFEIPMAMLRTALSKHESGDRLRASLTALMRVIVRVAYLDGTSEQRVMISGLLPKGPGDPCDPAIGHFSRAADHPRTVAAMGTHQGRGLLRHEVKVCDGTLRDARTAAEP